MTKYCSRCDRLLRLSAFHRKAGTWDGRQPWCKACVRVYQRQRYAVRHGVTTGGHNRLTAAVWPPAPRDTIQARVRDYVCFSCCWR
jgi:hypothetical protein